jgi:hypothetical protein
MLNHQTLPAAMVDSREFIAARRRAETELLVPEGTRIAFTGGTDCNDHQRIWSGLDRVHAKHPTWCCCMAVPRAAPSALPHAGPTIAKSRRLSSSPTEIVTATPRPSSATTR